MQSHDVIGSNTHKIAQLFPHCVTERLGKDGKPELAIDFEKLQAELSDEIIGDSEERYQFTWPDKRMAICLANRTTAKTLRPCREESVDFDNTKNLYLEGDNLEVLKVLRETYLGKIKMIYIDPPYNTGNDFVYSDDFAKGKEEYEQTSGLFDEDGNQTIDPMQRNTEGNGRFHTDWLNMIYPRLKVARDLLADDGVIFISIDDHEVDNLKKICSEIFGEANFVGCAGRITKKSNNKGDFWAPNFDYLLTFTKNRELAQEFTGGANESSYNLIEEDGPRKGERYQLVRLYMSSIQNRNPEQRFWIDCPDGSKIIPPGTTFPPERPNLGDGIWRWSRSTFEKNIDKIVIKKVRSSNLLNENHEPAEWNVFTKTYLNDVIDKSSAKPNNFIEAHINQIASHELNAINIPFDYAKPTTLISYLMKIAQVKSNDIVLDFFSGSATTAHSVMSYNNEEHQNVIYIMVQWPELIDEKTEAYKAGYKNICEIGKERIRRAGKKIKEEAGLQAQNLDTGFRVLKLDSSNMEDVYYTPQEFELQSLFMENVKADRTGEDLLFQVMLDLGVELSVKIENEKLKIENGRTITVHNVDKGYLMACFDRDIDEATITEIAKRQPVYFVMRDASAASDNVIDNFEQIFKHYSPDTVCRII